MNISLQKSKKAKKKKYIRKYKKEKHLPQTHRNQNGKSPQATSFIFPPVQLILKCLSTPILDDPRVLTSGTSFVKPFCRLMKLHSKFPALQPKFSVFQQVSKVSLAFYGFDIQIQYQRENVLFPVRSICTIPKKIRFY